MDKKPYYKQSAIVFAFIGVYFTLQGLEILLSTKWLGYVSYVCMAGVLIYAIISTVVIEKRKQ